MMRRSRISVRPNVKPGVRALPSSQDGQSSRAAVDTSQATKREGMQSITTETTQAGDKPAESVQSSENASPDMKETGQSFPNSGGSDTAVAVLQRRKRFSAMPNLAMPRVSTASMRTATRIPKSPPPKVPNLPPAETIALTPKDNSAAQGLRSPRWRRASGGGKPSKIQGKQAPLSPSGPASGKQTPLSPTVPAPGPVPVPQGENETDAPLECTKSSGLGKSTQEENSLPDPSPVSVTQSQSAKLETETPSCLPPGAQSVPSDRERIAKAQKLRELLKEELRKQRKRKKDKSICEQSIPQDHNKMTMRDLIYYLPESNPMKSYPVEENKLAEKEIPPSPSPLPQDLEVEAVEQEDDEDHEGDEPKKEQLVVPRVKVAADGTLILDEESLTVEVLRTKGPNLAEENDPIFERGSSTTYSSFRKAIYTKPWSDKETEMFFMAISMVGMDFSLIGELFPHRARTEIKNKFKKEERENSWRIDKAFKEKRRCDLESFSKLLERILDEEDLKKKKPKTKDSVGQKKIKSSPKGKKAADQRAPRDQSAEDDLDSDVVEGDSEMAEKENEDCSNVAEAGANTAAAKNNHKRKNCEGDESPHEKSADGRSVKKSRAEGSADDGALSDNSEGPACEVQPAASDVDRRERKPAKKVESNSTSPTHPKGVAAKGRGKQPVGPGKRAKPRPNLTQRNGRAGKPKLVTLRALLPEDNEEDEQDEANPEEDFHYPINPEEQNQAPAFVPISLRSPQPVTMEVVETMEELEISMNVSDVVGTAESEHALCSQPVCPGAQDEVVVSTEHQLDLLVDVIEFLSPDHVAGSEESYNEAARTLLTIRNPELLTLATPGYGRGVVIAEGSHHVQLEETEPRENLMSESGDQLQCSTEEPQAVCSDLLVAEIAQSATQSMHDMDSICLTPVEEFESVTVTSEPVLKPQSCETTSLEHTAVPEESHNLERPAPASTGDTHDGALGPKPSVPNVLPGRRSRFPKPKPNLARTARTPRVTPAQCTENSAAVAPVEPESLKTVEIEKKASDISPKEQVRESQENMGSGEEKLSQDETPCVGDSQGEGSGSDLSNQSVPPAGRARRFPKPTPILDRAVRKPRSPPPLSTPVAPSTEDDKRRPALGDTKARKFTEGETSGSSANGVSAEMENEDKGNRRAEGQAKMNQTNGACSIDTLKEQWPEDEGEKTHGTSVSIDTVQEATSLHVDGDFDTAVSYQATEGAQHQQPTFILTLFEVSPPLHDELHSGVDPPDISAELLSPLVFVDEQLALPPIQTETQSCDPLNVASVEMDAGHGQVSRPLVPASEEREDRPAHSSIWESAGMSTGVTSNSKISPVDSCDHLQVKPSSSTQNPEDPTERDQTIFRTEHLLLNPDQTSPLAGSPHPTPLDPAAQHTGTEAPVEPEPSATDDPARGILGCSDLPKLDSDGTTVAEGTGTKPQISHQYVPSTSDGIVTRRKPRGFLSFISDKSVAGPASAPRSARPACPRPQLNTSRRGRRAPTVSTPPPRAATANSQSQNAAKLATSQDESSSVKTTKTNKEPTIVSEYFFSDIFTQVKGPE
ncbi:hypothetical protein SKAU_G00360020 [Synaphobranchus kaupii]|uniref:Myb-like domain-containing protein n=1 Tax=Synaphobranchus kaupii TaxID=118154 RepID=A0A9Q1EI24_SYNKA|nr:hypothetical protein SKAU_G00360020 [Synaphobranchus kaupii]